MNKKFLGGLLVVGSLAFFWNCSSDTTSPCTGQCPTDEKISEFVVSESCYWLQGDVDMLIYSNGTVTDVSGNPIGTYDATTGTITKDDGSVIENINLEELTEITPEMVEQAKENKENQQEGTEENPGDDPDNQGNENHQSHNSSSSVSRNTHTQSSESGPQETGKVDASGYPIANYEKLTEGGAGVSKGYATRYWDACKPHCSWPEKVNENANPYRIARSCNIKGEEIPAFTKSEDGTWLKGTVSSCDGGGAYTCIDMIPVAVNDTLAYAFGAAPGADEKSTCGKCYQIQFNGEGKYGTKEAHGLLKKKTLIIMSSNVGYDVGSGQFDIMIPGGGVGLFDALSKQLGVNKSDLGKEYGGFYSTCEDQLGADASAAQFKSCVSQKCESVFKGRNSTMYDGCMWFVNWFEAANNPVTLFKQVECPQYLVDKYTSTINTSPSLSSAPSYQNY